MDDPTGYANHHAGVHVDLHIRVQGDDAGDATTNAAVADAMIKAGSLTDET